MNIKDHIEAGHYGCDGKGARHVPTDDGRTVIIVDTHGRYMCGWMSGWDFALTFNAFGRIISNGCAEGPLKPNLLPPPPRKVKVTGWAEVVGETINTFHFHKQFAEAAAEKTNEWAKTVKSGVYRVVELTGEYEEPWS